MKYTYRIRQGFTTIKGNVEADNVKEAVRKAIEIEVIEPISENKNEWCRSIDILVSEESNEQSESRILWEQ